MFLRAGQGYDIFLQFKVLQANIASPICLFYHISSCRLTLRQPIFILSWVNSAATAVEAQKENDDRRKGEKDEENNDRID